MANVRQLVERILERPGINAALLLSGDGLPIAHASQDSFGLDAEAAAALATTLIRELARLGEAVTLGSASSAVLEYEQGLVVLTQLAERDWLVAIATPDADVGELLYDLRRHRAVLAALL